MSEISHTIITPYLVPDTACGELGINTVCVRFFLGGIYGEYNSNPRSELSHNQNNILVYPVVANSFCP